MKIYSYNNIKDCLEFYSTYSISRCINKVMKYFNDNNIDNYVMCYIDIIYKRAFEFDEDLYNNIHKQYLEYLIKNPDTKLIIYTNGKYGYNWCTRYLKFINTRILYVKDVDRDLNYILNLKQYTRLFQ